MKSAAQQQQASTVPCAALTFRKWPKRNTDCRMVKLRSPKVPSRSPKITPIRGVSQSATRALHKAGASSGTAPYAYLKKPSLSKHEHMQSCLHTAPPTHLTSAVKLVPTTMATARSITLPLWGNSNKYRQMECAAEQRGRWPAWTGVPLAPLPLSCATVCYSCCNSPQDEVSKPCSKPGKAGGHNQEKGRSLPHRTPTLRLKRQPQRLGSGQAPRRGCLENSHTVFRNLPTIIAAAPPEQTLPRQP